MQIEIERPADQTRMQRLKAQTNVTHERLDTRIMAAEPFTSRERYAQFLDVQHHFHADVDPLYLDAELNRLLPGLSERIRLPQLRQDITDVTGNAPPLLQATTSGIDVATALGWLYVAEGSNLGAAFLLKEAAKLGLSDSFGARHLGAHPAGRGLHWRNFVAAFNELDLSEDEEARMAEGSRQAFLRVHALVKQTFA